MIDHVAFATRGHLIGGNWIDPGDRAIQRENPANTAEIAGSYSDGAPLIDEAVRAARGAQFSWAQRPLADRIAVLQAFGAALAERSDAIAAAITAETGKTIVESRAECAALTAKIEITSALAHAELAPVQPDGLDGYWDYRPLGVMGVVGPFNFPVHLSNGHIVPALIAGNTVVLKPSESAPACAELYARAWIAAATATGAPASALNVVQGRGDAGAALAEHGDVDCVAFTGSYDVGVRIRRATAHQTGKLLALEMGGKNATIVCAGADVDRAAEICGEAAFRSTGQRCTATSRVLVHESVAEPLIAALLREAATWLPGDPKLEATRMGPLATRGARDRFVAAQSELAGLQTILVGGATDGPAPGYWVRPAIHRVRDVNAAANRVRTELFGPEILVETWREADEAVARANATPWGLAAAVLGATDEEFAWLRARIRAGLINRDRGTAGASSRLPFGGLGQSGNHRPAAAMSLRYCVAPVATLLG